MRGGLVTVRMDKRIKATIATIDDDAWTMIDYTDAVFDETALLISPESPRSTTCLRRTTQADHVRR